MSSIAKTPKPPYYAVIFTSIKNKDADGYNEISVRMVELASQQPGFLGIESARNEIGITISYWESEAAFMNWKKNTEHLIAQQMGKEKWYQYFRERVCKVEREYGTEKKEKK
ncbi:MAG: antibiotic biosynthesis monooxygenase [Chitinophagales bacterium]|nr:antibiotic biosynthesis monooxygenase [Chitinophagales bacterium]